MLSQLGVGDPSSIVRFFDKHRGRPSAERVLQSSEMRAKLSTSNRGSPLIGRFFKPLMIPAEGSTGAVHAGKFMRHAEGRDAW